MPGNGSVAPFIDERHTLIEDFEIGPPEGQVAIRFQVFGFDAHTVDGGIATGDYHGATLHRKHKGQSRICQILHP